MGKRKSNKPYVRWKIKLSASILYKRVPCAVKAACPPTAARPSPGGWKERESGERSLISQSGPPVEHNCKTAFSAVRPTFSGAPSIPIRQSDDTFRGLPPEPSRPLTLLFGAILRTNKQTNRLRLYSMIPCCQK